MRVVLACKKTTLEALTERYGAGWRGMLGRFDLDAAEVGEEHGEHYRALDALVQALRAEGIEPEIHTRRGYGPGTFSGADLVVSVGGDGEMLDVARYIRGRELVLGYRSYSRSAGRLLLPPVVPPADIARAFCESRYLVEEWTRVEGTIHNGGEPVTDLALNEIYIGDRYSVGTARYTLHLDGREEKQRSSGIIVSSGAGSTGWYGNVLVPSGEGACHRGAPFDRCSPELRFVVRDLIREPGDGGTAAGRVSPTSVFTVKSTMSTDGIVSFDGSKESYEIPRAYPFDRGAWVEIRAAIGSLRVFALP